MTDTAPTTPGPTLSRRRFVAVAAGATGFLALGGCSVPTSIGAPDPLLELVDAAERDAREFAAAGSSHGEFAEALRSLAGTRKIQADELRKVTEASDVGTSTTSATADAGSAVVCPPVDEVRARLEADASLAADLAVAEQDIRAELVAAVSAACTCAVEVTLK